MLVPLIAKIRKMAASFLAIASLLTVSMASGQDLPERNPQLGIYQDESKCFPFQGTLYQVYRNFEDDPYFGGDAKCIRSSQAGDPQGDAIPVKFEFGTDGFLNTTFELMSSLGYSVDNVIHVTPVNNPEQAFNLTVAYRSCTQCKVLRHSYIANGTGCSYWVTDMALNETNACCQFVFDLLCGTSPKYQIYEKGC